LLYRGISSIIRTVKLAIQIQLFPDKEQAMQLRQTVEAFSSACNWLAQEAFTRKVSNNIVLQKLYYFGLREQFGLSAQMAAICIRHVASTYKRAKSKLPKFRKHAAMPYDRRILSFKGLDRVSLKTLAGRVIVPMVMGKYQHERFGAAQGQCNLVLRKDGKWFLLATVDLPEAAPVPNTDFIGVDLGVANLATDSDGRRHTGEQVEAFRQKHHARRKALQEAAAKRKARGRRPKQIRAALKRSAQKESRFRRDTNHRISKQLVAKAKGSLRGIALEDLSGIRDRTKFRKRQRAKMSGWAFSQLRGFIEYKGMLDGVPVVLVDPRNTSRTCNECGHCEKANRKSQAEFVCKHCSHTIHADLNAARNIRARALVNAPMVSERRIAKATRLVQTQAVSL
jgi:putative transposase